MDSGPERASHPGEAALAAASNVIRRLASARDGDEAERLYWSIDSVFVRNGSLRPGADEIVGYVVDCLKSAGPVGRPQLLDLLVQIGGGHAQSEYGGDHLAYLVRRNTARGLNDYIELMFSGSRSERFQCIDLLSICAEVDEENRERIVDELVRVAAVGERERELSSAVLREMGR